MLELLIPLVIVMLLLIGILEYLDLFEVTIGGLGLIFAALYGLVKLIIGLVRRLWGWSKPPSGAASPEAALLKSPPPSPETGFRANRGRGAGSRKRP